MKIGYSGSANSGRDALRRRVHEQDEAAAEPEGETAPAAWVAGRRARSSRPRARVAGAGSAGDAVQELGHCDYPSREGSSASHDRTCDTISRYRRCLASSGHTTDGSSTVQESM